MVEAVVEGPLDLDATIVVEDGVGEPNDGVVEGDGADFAGSTAKVARVENGRCIDLLRVDLNVASHHRIGFELALSFVTRVVLTEVGRNQQQIRFRDKILFDRLSFQHVVFNGFSFQHVLFAVLFIVVGKDKPKLLQKRV